MGTQEGCPACYSPPQCSANPGGPGAPSAETPVLSHRSCLHLQIRLHAGKIFSFHPQGKADCQIFSFPILTCATLKCLMYDQKSPTPTGPSQQIKSAAAARRKSAAKEGDMPENEPVLLHLVLQGSEGTKPKKIKKEKPRENRRDKTRIKPEQFLLQLHTLEEKQRNASKSIPHATAALAWLWDWLSQEPRHKGSEPQAPARERSPRKRDPGEASPALCAPRSALPACPVCRGCRKQPFPAPPIPVTPQRHGHRAGGAAGR